MRQVSRPSRNPVCLRYSTWIGSVTNPAPRSSQDCRNAALAIEQAAVSVSALWSGAYKCTRASLDADVWPGDALALNAPLTNLNAQMVVRSVKLTYTASYPDLVQYAISFANDWADDLAIKTSETVPADAWLPVAISPTYLPDLNGLGGDGDEQRKRDNQHRSHSAKRWRIRDSPARQLLHAGH